MKLIRLSTFDINCQFDSYFTEDIKIKANSQIALKNISIGTQVNTIVISGANDNITYNIRASAAGSVDKVITIPHGEYTINNFKDFLRLITQQLNRSLGSEGKEKGFQWFVGTDIQGRIEFRGLQADFVNHTAELTQNIPIKQLNPPIVAQRVLTFIQSNGGVYTVGNNKQIDNSLICSTYMNQPICRGSGIFQCQIYKANDVAGADDFNGFIFGLTTVNPSSYITTRAMTPSDFNYAIEIQRQSTAATGAKDQPYRYWVNGVSTTSTTNVEYFSEGNANNPYLNFTIADGKLQFNVYQNTTVTKTTLHEIQFNNEDTLFGFFIIRGAGAGITHRLNKIIYTSDPFEDPSVLSQNTVDEDISNGLTVPQPPTGQGLRTPSSGYIQFNGASLATFLGFDNLRNPLANFQIGRNFTFTADNSFVFSEKADAFIVELLNIQLTSYDDYDPENTRKGGRKSILAVVPESDNNKTILYEPNTLDFIDIDNTSDLNIRNFKLKVSKNDYSDLSCSGLSTVTLLIKDKGE